MEGGVYFKADEDRLRDDSADCGLEKPIFDFREDAQFDKVSSLLCL